MNYNGVLTSFRAFAPPGRTCLFCFPCGQGYIPRLDKAYSAMQWPSKLP